MIPSILVPAMGGSDVSVDINLAIIPQLSLAF